MKPSAQVNQRHAYCEDKRDWRRSQYAMMNVWHGAVSYRRGPEPFSVSFSGPSSSTTSREASRAGACPGGCNVWRNATSAVVSGGLKFFPYVGMLPPP